MGRKNKSAKAEGPQSAKAEGPQLVQNKDKQHQVSSSQRRHRRRPKSKDGPDSTKAVKPEGTKLVELISGPPSPRPDRCRPSVMFKDGWKSCDSDSDFEWCQDDTLW